MEVCVGLAIALGLVAIISAGISGYASNVDTRTVLHQATGTKPSASELGGNIGMGCLWLLLVLGAAVAIVGIGGALR